MEKHVPAVNSKPNRSFQILGCSICALLGFAFAGAQSGLQGPMQFDNRVEGTTVHRDDLEDFTLLAIHRSFEEFPRNSRLGVRFYVPSLDQTATQTVFVQAGELQDTSQHYFMHSKPITQLESNAFHVFTPWPTADVIDRLPIKPKNIGVLAGWQESGSTIYSPVDVFEIGHHPSDGPYTFWFVVGHNVQTLEIFVTNERGQRVLPLLGKQTCNLSIDPDCALYPSASTQAISIDFSSVPGGKYKVRFVGHFPGSSKQFAFPVLIYHPSSSGGSG
jgi:hypothetical protein